MRINLPCTCDDEEHELEVQPEGRGYYGDSAGDKLPCGRIMTDDDVMIICERIHDSTIDEG